MAGLAVRAGGHVQEEDGGRVLDTLTSNSAGEGGPTLRTENNLLGSVADNAGGLLLGCSPRPSQLLLLTHGIVVQLRTKPDLLDLGSQTIPKPSTHL